MTDQQLCEKLSEIVPEVRAALLVGTEAEIHLDGPLKFTHLDAISNMLGTERIDIDSELDSLGCESCGYGAGTVIILTCYGVKFDG